MNNAPFWHRHYARVSVETIQLIGVAFQRGGFWPRLCSLKCNTGWEIVPFLSSFLNPAITDIYLVLPRNNSRLLPPTLSLLAHTCHQLQSLTVDADTSDPLSASEMGRLISASRRTLRRLVIRPSTPPDIFPVILDLPQLQDLTLQEPCLPNQIPPGVLPRLRAIEFRGDHGPNLRQFLRGASVSRLTTVMIKYGGIIQPSVVLEPLRGASATMDVLSLSPVKALGHSIITLLCFFTNLTHLVIGCICEDPGQSGLLCSLQLTDGDVLELGKALPHIRFLSLTPGCNTPRHVTFTSLTCLSRTCGNLNSLEIRVDFTSIISGSDKMNHSNHSPIDGTRPQRGVNRLDKLFVGNSPLPEAPHCERAVALALVAIFPSIGFLSSYIDGMPNRRWEKVWGEILACRATGGCLSA